MSYHFNYYCNYGKGGKFGGKFYVGLIKFGIGGIFIGIGILTIRK